MVELSANVEGLGFGGGVADRTFDAGDRWEWGSITTGVVGDWARRLRVGDWIFREDDGRPFAEAKSIVGVRGEGGRMFGTE